MSTGSIELVGQHQKYVKAIEHANNLSVTKAPVLVVGEIGVGKSTICHYIHSRSVRANAEFSIVDCAQEAQLVENAILGHRDEESGHFSKGALEATNGGTVVFKNIDALEETFQKRLYTILQELSDYDLDIRVMATTTKNLSKYVGAGRFHRALYTIFSNSQITLIPLREREGDISLLATHFLNGFNASSQESSLSFDEAAILKMNSYYWTHNLTELKAVVESACENAVDGIIDVNAIELGEKRVDSTTMDGDEDGLKLMSLKDAEKLLIKKALIHTSENRTQAAKILGVSIRTLRNKINEYRNEGNNYFVNLR